ncbi:MAG: UDP-N-acetylmuramoyl-L-alanine--D-glutamate ligase [Bacillota bacterium]|jgi:UDP-N-acetylmuramoylalanine--D-glutamate ligase|nr:UDP-N-acetylmuramoyl-L-alanine--D-glutamate ligase [Bacillota bacterium]
MFSGKKVIVLGGAKSGISAAQVLVTLGAEVTLTDITPLHQMPEPERIALQDMNIRLVTGSHPTTLLEGADLIVKNPGISPEIEFLQAARELGVPWISELELAWLITKAEFVAITGTNGKTTTTALTGEILARGSRPVAVGGNIGIPLTSISFGKGPEWLLVVETSSFQLEDCYKLHPRVAIFTNLTPDHLDRHKSMENYLAAKLRLIQNQDSDDYVVVNRDDPILARQSFGRGQKIWYSLKPGQGDCYIEDGWFCWRGERLAPAGDLSLPGEHNLQNALAAIAAAKALRLPAEEIRQGLRGFAGVEHRLEYVGEVRGIKFYNDSKATNPESTSTALHSFAGKVLLLAGGYDKGAEFVELVPLFLEKVKHLFTFGDTGEKIRREAIAGGFMEVSPTLDLADAFNQAVSIASPGDIVLLSPACASWDQYANFEERGKHFKALIKSWREKL